MGKKRFLWTAIISKQEAGLEAGLYLRKAGAVSKRQLQKIIRTRGLYLNGRVAHSKTILEAGDQLQAVLPKQEQIKIPLGEKDQLAVLFEDQWLLAVQKAAGQAFYTLKDNTGLANQVAAYFLSHGLKLAPRPLHRLDQPTSGVALFAKSAQIQTSLSQAWGQGQVKRYYWALCAGQLKTSLEISLPLDGRKAATKVLPLRVFPKFTELELELITGRKHQIRRHLKEIGHPVLGDRRYGKSNIFLKRLALHAAKIVFPHPRGKRPLEITAPVPFLDFPFLETTEPPLL